MGKGWYEKMEEAGVLAPKGECKTCDKIRENKLTFFPAHTASSRCESGNRNHCTCQFCF